MKVIIIGDIHSCDSLIRKCKEEILNPKNDINPNRDHIIFLGDLLDRGERGTNSSSSTYSTLSIFGQIYDMFTPDRFHYVVGNHDLMLWQALEKDVFLDFTGDWDNFVLNGAWCFFSAIKKKPLETAKLLSKYCEILSKTGCLSLRFNWKGKKVRCSHSGPITKDIDGARWFGSVIENRVKYEHFSQNYQDAFTVAQKKLWNRFYLPIERTEEHKEVEEINVQHLKMIKDKQNSNLQVFGHTIINASNLALRGQLQALWRDDKNFLFPLDFGSYLYGTVGLAIFDLDKNTRTLKIIQNKSFIMNKYTKEITNQEKIEWSAFTDMLTREGSIVFKNYTKNFVQNLLRKREIQFIENQNEAKPDENQNIVEVSLKIPINKATEPIVKILANPDENKEILANPDENKEILANPDENKVANFDKRDNRGLDYKRFKELEQSYQATIRQRQIKKFEDRKRLRSKPEILKEQDLTQIITLLNKTQNQYLLFKPDVSFDVKKIVALIAILIKSLSWNLSKAAKYKPLNGVRENLKYLDVKMKCPEICAHSAVLVFYWLSKIVIIDRRSGGDISKDTKSCKALRKWLNAPTNISFKKVVFNNKTNSYVDIKNFIEVVEKKDIYLKFKINIDNRSQRSLNEKFKFIEDNIIKLTLNKKSFKLMLVDKIVIIQNYYEEANKYKKIESGKKRRQNMENIHLFAYGGSYQGKTLDCGYFAATNHMKACNIDVETFMALNILSLNKETTYDEIKKSFRFYIPGIYQFISLNENNKVRAMVDVVPNLKNFLVNLSPNDKTQNVEAGAEMQIDQFFQTFCTADNQYISCIIGEPGHWYHAKFYRNKYIINDSLKTVTQTFRYEDNDYLSPGNQIYLDSEVRTDR